MSWRVSFAKNISEIAKSDWQSLFVSKQPFVHYDYLLALEQTGCVSRDTGWQPYHLKLEWQTQAGQQQQNNQLVALMPLYLKSHSYGEYMFDWSWARAFEQLGADYYPKLINAIPFTPISGPRLAITAAFSDKQTEILSVIKQSLLELAEQLGLSNVQCLFNQPQDLMLFPNTNHTDINSQTRSWQLREDVQFHWFNRDYQSFTDFLSQLTARKRKSISKERAKVAQQRVIFEQVNGPEITAELWQQFYQCYQLTYAKRSGHLGYLSYDCFLTWGQALTSQITMIVAKLADDNAVASPNVGQVPIVAASLFFHDDKQLYGRYWGCFEEFEFLHFEACYYQGIELAIKLGVSCFNAGAQGEHKVARGFAPVSTYGHYLWCSGLLSEQISDFLARERHYHHLYRNEMQHKLPFKLMASR